MYNLYTRVNCYTVNVPILKARHVARELDMKGLRRYAFIKIEMIFWQYHYRKMSLKSSNSTVWRATSEFKSVSCEREHTSSKHNKQNNTQGPETDWAPFCQFLLTRRFHWILACTNFVRKLCISLAKLEFRRLISNLQLSTRSAGSR